MTFYAGDTVTKVGKKKLWVIEGAIDDSDGYERVQITRGERKDWIAPEDLVLYGGGEVRKLHDQLDALRAKHAEADKLRREEADAVTAISIDAGMIPVAWLRTVLLGRLDLVGTSDGWGRRETTATLVVNVDKSRAAKALVEALRK